MGQFDSRQRVTGQDGFFNIQAIHELTNIFCEGIGVIACFRIIGIALSAAGESQDAELVRKARGKLVEDVSGTSHAREKDQRPTVHRPNPDNAGGFRLHVQSRFWELMNSFLFFLYKFPAPTANKIAGLRALR